MTRDERRLAANATGQRGAFTSRQARVAGVTSSSLRSRVQSGSLQKIGVRTYCSTHVPPSILADLHALVVDVGPPAWASGVTAGALHHFDGLVLRPPFHLVTLRDRNVRRIGHVIHTTTALDPVDCCMVEGIPCLSPVRAVLEVARELTLRELTAVIDGGLRDRLFDETQLHRRASQLRSHGRSGVGPVIEALGGVDAMRGGHSWLEREFLNLLFLAGLPLPTMQVVLSRAGDRVIRVDGRYQDSRVLVEILGYRWHRTEAQMSHDAERMNKLVLAGYRPVQFTYRQIVDTPDAVVAMMREVLTKNL